MVTEVPRRIPFQLKVRRGTTEPFARLMDAPCTTACAFQILKMFSEWHFLGRFHRFQRFAAYPQKSGKFKSTTFTNLRDFDRFCDVLCGCLWVILDVFLGLLRVQIATFSSRFSEPNILPPKFADFVQDLEDPLEGPIGPHEAMAANQGVQGPAQQLRIPHRHDCMPEPGAPAVSWAKGHVEGLAIEWRSDL